MIRTWKTLTMYSLLSAAVVTLAPPPVLFANEKKEVVPVKADDDLKLAVDALTKRITALENKKLSDADKAAIAQIVASALQKLEDGALAKLNNKIDDSHKRIDSVKEEVAALKTEQLRHQLKIDNQKVLIEQLSKRLDSLNASPVPDKAMLDTLNAIKDGIAKLGKNEQRLAMSPPLGATANTGRVMLVNHYGDELLFVLNGTGYRVAPFTSKLVENVPAGSVGVEVFASRFGTFHRQGATLAAGDTFTLTANPPR